MDTITILGLFAAFFTTASYVPQAIKTIRSKDTKDIALSMYILLCIGGLLWFIYGVYSKSWPIMIANGISLLFSCTIMVFKIKFK
ncbi:MAG: SemiSWEET transporter [Opitutaceae bacterium]|nr:SemiSWEET transporter [Cytophagales bacterium]